MEQPFEVVQFAHYVRRRWLAILISCTVAISITAGMCMILPKRYTATASVLIEPPAGNDPRGATAISPVYIESLKTYERFAASDTVFAKALRDLGMQKEFADRSFESIKRSVLKVARPTSTRILEISVTLSEPVGAQKLAQNIAEQSVALNRTLNDKSSDDVLGEARKTLRTAATRLKETEQRADDVLKKQPVDVLQNELAGINQVRLGVEQDLSKTRAELADMKAEIKTFHDGDGMEAQALWTRRQIDALEARENSLSQQAETLNKAASEKSSELENRRNSRDVVTTQLRSARADYDSEKTKLLDAQNSAAYRGERLEIMDPGIVPQRPSYPNTPLNLMIASLLSVVVSVGYLAVRFSYSRRQERMELAEYSLR
jgi:uncharacterized protein involved in exopolysaccharide biosynthesis